jgi:hypothetical protein
LLGFGEVVSVAKLGDLLSHKLKIIGSDPISATRQSP